ncbi:MAG: hypothetical protein R3C56_36565 [Pirellulaceae bacterium]
MLRLNYREEALDIRRNIVELTNRRLKQGDISELETIAAKVDSLNAEAAAGVQQQVVGLAEARLASLIGLPTLDAPLSPSDMTLPNIPPLDEKSLIEERLPVAPTTTPPNGR